MDTPELLSRAQVLDRSRSPSNRELRPLTENCTWTLSELLLEREADPLGHGIVVGAHFVGPCRNHLARYLRPL